uniref:Uncharacterized protein n=1 Tax=Romanomermis culicivorax TaxID=13658 RepID=A0A915L8B3_ROMCU
MTKGQMMECTIQWDAQERKLPQSRWRMATANNWLETQVTGDGGLGSGGSAALGLRMAKEG